MNKAIVITTINSKTEGIKKFEILNDGPIIIVGDKKTPEYSNNESLRFISVNDQRDEFPALAEHLPYNHYARKNIGYLYAIKCQADSIYDTDDDNLPYDDWGFEAFQCDQELSSASRYLNIYKHFTNQHVWPRGLPLDEVLAKNECQVRKLSSPVEIGVWQGLADNDPDVDAIYRLTNGQIVKFDKKPPIAVSRDSYTPFNSQNTLWRRELLPLMYLPAFVSFRLTDILRSYVAQVLMHHHGFQLGYYGATVYQERNEHDLVKDFSDEIDCYLHIKEMVGVLNMQSYSQDMNNNLLLAYESLIGAGFVPEKELAPLKAWINEIIKLS